MIDYLTFTFGIETVYSWFPNEIIGDNQIIEYLSLVVDQIFGFGVLCKLPGKGKFFYDGYYQLGPDNANYGQIHVDGQNDTVLIDLKGVGCMAAKQGWEVSLYHFLKHADRPRITRIDLACDFLNGEYTPNQAYEDHENGLFDNGNRRPKKDTRGSSWHKQDFSGMTLFIGSRGSAKYCRIYEKGRQLGDPDSPWVRFEVEFRKADSVLPLDMLIKPGQYLTGAYPIGETLFQNKAERVETVKRMLNINFDKLERHARQQVGRMMNFMLDIGIKPNEICERLKAEDGKYPKANLQNGQNLTPEMFVPTIPERVESKPIYNSIRQVQQYERLAACIDGGKSGCTCYTDQATKIKEIPQKECKQYAKDGLPFDPFRQPPVTAPMMPQQQETPVEAPKVASLGGQDKLTLLPDYTKGPTAQ